MQEVRNRQLLDLRDEFSSDLPKCVVENIDSLIAAGEWGVALEELCNMLFEHDRPVTSRQMGLIEAAAHAMGMPEDSWSVVRALVAGLEGPVS